MSIYQIKIETKPYKPNEFVDTMRSLLPSIHKGKACLNFSLYQDALKENAYLVVGEWETDQDMETHFRSDEFELLIGTARVLCKTFTMNIAEVLKTGGFELAREKHRTLADD